MGGGGKQNKVIPEDMRAAGMQNHLQHWGRRVTDVFSNTIPTNPPASTIPASESSLVVVEYQGPDGATSESSIPLDVVRLFLPPSQHNQANQSTSRRSNRLSLPESRTGAAAKPKRRPIRKAASRRYSANATEISQDNGGSSSGSSTTTLDPASHPLVGCRNDADLLFSPELSNHLTLGNDSPGRFYTSQSLPLLTANPPFHAQAGPSSQINDTFNATHAYNQVSSSYEGHGMGLVPPSGHWQSTPTLSGLTLVQEPYVMSQYDQSRESYPSSQTRNTHPVSSLLPSDTLLLMGPSTTNAPDGAYPPFSSASQYFLAPSDLQYQAEESTNVPPDHASPSSSRKSSLESYSSSNSGDPSLGSYSLSQSPATSFASPLPFQTPMMAEDGERELYGPIPSYAPQYLHPPSSIRSSSYGRSSSPLRSPASSALTALDGTRGSSQQVTHSVSQFVCPQFPEMPNDEEMNISGLHLSSPSSHDVISYQGYPIARNEHSMAAENFVLPAGMGYTNLTRSHTYPQVSMFSGVPGQVLSRGGNSRYQHRMMNSVAGPTMQAGRSLNPGSSLAVPRSQLRSSPYQIQNRLQRHTPGSSSDPAMEASKSSWDYGNFEYK